MSEESSDYVFRIINNTCNDFLHDQNPGMCYYLINFRCVIIFNGINHFLYVPSPFLGIKVVSDMPDENATICETPSSNYQGERLGVAVTTPIFWK